jgi:hypothetical protein
LQAKVFIDAGYEGDLMARAGVKYAVGRESKAEYGEEAAGIRFDKTPRQASQPPDSKTKSGQPVICRMGMIPRFSPR